MILREIFAKNVRLARKHKGLSQEDLAFESGLDRTYISCLERCVYSPSLDAVEKLAAAFELEPYWLLMTPAEQEQSEMAEEDPA
ncbi:helix-turn-helix domain-containing protein [Roseibium algae]|uniref:Helix-turn-helix transcriptional regulator n=1 Tax=Roseibium algae TaxID=3123038 RepID=A0ABU8TRW7_9HYPH